ncbi:hypothetical protein [Acetomicrobium sp.]|nr:hypothetical protein [Acetomicrobium sp.]MDR9770462.1 hypothetical protein [Acetomicrobium sp.]
MHVKEFMVKLQDALMDDHKISILRPNWTKLKVGILPGVWPLRS